jgi:hypothetical protein
MQQQQQQQHLSQRAVRLNATVKKFDVINSTCCSLGTADHFEVVFRIRATRYIVHSTKEPGSSYKFAQREHQKTKNLQVCIDKSTIFLPYEPRLIDLDMKTQLLIS